MAILSTVDTSVKNRELTPKQQSFLDNLIETQGDAKKAAELAGYKSHYHHVVKTLKSEILELTQNILANSAPKAAFKLVEIMESNKPIIQANNKITAAQTLLDRVGVAKIDRVDVNHNVYSGGIFLMPDKAPLELEDGEYDKLLQACKEVDLIYLERAFVFSIETCVRQGELLRARWEHINFKKKTLYIPDTKTGHLSKDSTSNRTIPLSSLAIKTLNKLPRHISGRIFPITRDQLNQKCKKQ